MQIIDFGTIYELDGELRFEGFYTTGHDKNPQKALVQEIIKRLRQTIKRKN